MAEPLKHIYNEAFLRQFSDVLVQHYPAFNTETFMNETMDEQWEALELKARMRKITEELGKALPPTFREAIRILLKVNESCSGFPYLVLPDFVEVFGTAEEDWDLAMTALEQFTAHSTSEYAVRPYIIRDHERMMKQMLIWAKHDNEHVRRLASEGCRPSLPWGMALNQFKKDPTPILPILELLKADSSLYVRKSVANNINDISKQHGDLVISIAKRWYGSNVHTNWIVRHGCRTLLKQANPDILALFGYAKHTEQAPLLKAASIQLSSAAVKLGESNTICYELDINGSEPVHLRIEYGIYFIKANKKPSLKKFLLSDKTVNGGTRLEGKRRHSWADLTTRKHYPGSHKIVLVVNGVQVAEIELLLTL